MHRGARATIRSALSFQTTKLSTIVLAILSFAHLSLAATYSTSTAYSGTWRLTQPGTTGVAAMQVAVSDNDQILIIDRVEGNPLQVNGHSAWGAIYTISTNTVRPLNMKSNSFCAGGSWLSNGTMANVGGDPRNGTNSGNGVQAIRLYTPCGAGTCDIYDDPSKLSLNSPRWYPTITRLPDGSLMILGGVKYAQYTDNP